jgi:two-component system, sensor histidine kinase and response regulator
MAQGSDSHTHFIDQPAVATMILDAAYDAFVAIDGRGHVTYWNKQAELLFGYSQEQALDHDMASLIIPPSQRDAHWKGLRHFQATGEGPILNKRIEITAINNKGEEFAVELAVFPIDPHSKFAFGAFIEDISARKEQEKWQNVHHRISQIIASSTDVAEAMRTILEAVCSTAGWDLGVVWEITLDNKLQYLQSWSQPGVDCQAFISASQEIIFRHGEGIPGRIWRFAQPFSSADICTDENFPRRDAAQTCGLQSAFAFPLVSGDKVVGIIEFYSKSKLMVHNRVFELLQTTGSVMGQFMERKRSEHLMQTILDNMIEGVCVLNRDLQVVLWNRANAEWMTINNGMTPLQWPEQGVFASDGKTPYPQDKLPSILALQGEKILQAEVFVTTKDKPEGAYLSVNALPLLANDGTVIGVLNVARDVTRRKQMEKELQNARDFAERASAMKSQFVSTVSHEIRTPLSGIIGMAELLSEKLKSSEHHHLVEYILDASHDLLSILNDLLDFSKIEAGKMRLEFLAFSPRKLLEEVMRILEPSAERKNLIINSEVDSDIPDQIIGDPTRVKQVLLNLGSNAVKFTASGGINLSLKNEPPDLIKFEVQDTGIGISKEHIKNLFQPFKQADERVSRQYGGTGLGLSISAALIKLMSGDHGMSSTPDEGSSFWFVIPKNPR